MTSRFKDLELGHENGVTAVGQPLLEGDLVEGSDNRVSLSGDASNSGSVYPENTPSVMRVNVEAEESKDAKNKSVKEKRKSLGHKKHPRPPRPPRAPSLDAADQKLIREIAELARLKRARIERMKALKKSRAAKPTPSSTSSNMFAMVFTIVFCLVIMFQGMCSGGTPASNQGSPLPAGAAQPQGVPSLLQFSMNPSANFRNQQDSESPNLVEQVAGLEGEQKLGRFSG
ncbi:putative Plant invertase/pectin methylesterase inhibitor superfamily protein [Hibiscus syriacus]|uniref:Plant invertase/pectin methylesterase inhibitor superfamily protein n=1 Tax=Hibiscus syriacus TaxID=106335 RepID=A0A6A2Y2H6_HIBSY|nr:uncharacterized protein LOC120176064 [Hibiscus syriacus]KAE8669646.1 putative Plant invertase/pectin methylesterase inhibitor superfamily protein [Hibiscus syriacus]